MKVWIAPLMRGNSFRLALGVLAMALAWQLSVVLFKVPVHYLPGLPLIAERLSRYPDPFIAGFIRTASEMLIGLAVGTLFGLLSAVVMQRYRMVRHLLLPLFIISQTIPVIAFGAIVVMWFGNSLLAKAVIAFYLTFFTITVNTLAGLDSVDPKQISLLRSFGASNHQLLWRLQLPSALPAFFTGLKLAVATSLSGAIVGEWFGDTTGLGVLLLQSMYSEDTISLWSAILLVALLGSVCFGVVAAIEKRVLFWQHEQDLNH